MRLTVNVDGFIFRTSANVQFAKVRNRVLSDTCWYTIVCRILVDDGACWFTCWFKLVYVNGGPAECPKLVEDLHTNTHKHTHTHSPNTHTHHTLQHTHAHTLTTHTHAGKGDSGVVYPGCRGADFVVVQRADRPPRVLLPLQRRL